ncbi:MAG: SDR family NAD(P)-dependent oxidoreductase [Myxococcota bacterium]
MKTILITGSTDGIGFEAARRLLDGGHRVLLHGRSADKLADRRRALEGPHGTPEGYVADLSDLDQVAQLAETVATEVPGLDVLINNAGVFNHPAPRLANGLDVRFVVNTIASYVLGKRLGPVLGASGRVINVSSAAQAPADLDALIAGGTLSDGAAYAQSKLALTAWTRRLAERGEGPLLVSVNPGSMLGSKMVKEAFGVAGREIEIGAQILERAALDPAFAEHTGAYFDNDAGRFAPPHPRALDDAHADAIIGAMERILDDAR